jgi:GxxExxY protein
VEDARHLLAISGGSPPASTTGMFADLPSSPITRQIIGAAIEVHREVGPGVLESVYLTCLEYELTVRNLPCVRQKVVPIVYKEIRFDVAHRVDLIVDDVVVVEVKSVETLLPIHQAQALTYLSLTGCPVGLLINFNVPKLVDGVKRLINPRATAAQRTPTNL